MSSERFTDQRLREEFGRLDGIAEGGAGCPPAERLVMAGRGEIDRPEREEVFLHLTRCPACAAAWRAARELAPDPKAAKRRLPTFGWVRLAAAAVVLVGVIGAGFFLLYPDRETVPVYRTQQDQWLRSEIEEGQPLSRDNFLLRWTAGPEGTYYDLLVLSEKLETQTEMNGLAGPEYRVPEEVLTGIPSGSRILWQVTARLPDGRTIESDTFITQID